MSRRPDASPLIAPESRAPRRRAAGRHTSLIDDAADERPVEGTGQLPATGLSGGGTRVRIRGEAGRDEYPGADPPGSPADTVVMGGPGLFGGPLPRDGSSATWPRIGVNREPPPRPWYKNRARLTITAAGLAVVAFAGFLGVPALLRTLGVGAGTQSGFCPLCQFPVPSSAPVPAGAMPPPASPAAPAPAAKPHATASARAAVAASPAATAAPPRTAPASQPTTSPLVVTYSVQPESGGQFDGQVTIDNRGASAITNWQLIVALPGDTVSAVQNAEITDSSDVLFLSPAPDDLSIAPGATVTVSIFASGGTTNPAECSLDGVPCQLPVSQGSRTLTAIALARQPYAVGALSKP